MWQQYGNFKNKAHLQKNLDIVEQNHKCLATQISSLALKNEFITMYSSLETYITLLLFLNENYT